MLQQPQGEDADTTSAGLTPPPPFQLCDLGLLLPNSWCAHRACFPHAIHSTCPFKRGSFRGSSDAPFLNWSMALGSLKFQGESLGMQHCVFLFLGLTWLLPKP